MLTDFSDFLGVQLAIYFLSLVFDPKQFLACLVVKR